MQQEHSGVWPTENRRPRRWRPHILRRWQRLCWTHLPSQRRRKHAAWLLTPLTKILCGGKNLSVRGRVVAEAKPPTVLTRPHPRQWGTGVPQSKNDNKSRLLAGHRNLTLALLRRQPLRRSSACGTGCKAPEGYLRRPTHPERGSRCDPLPTEELQNRKPDMCTRHARGQRRAYDAKGVLLAPPPNPIHLPAQLVERMTCLRAASCEVAEF